MKDTLVSNGKYPILLNGVPLVREDGRLFHADTTQIENSFDSYRLDKRTRGVAIYSNMSFEEYCNYFKYIILQLNRRYTDISVHDSIPDLLDQGYIPLIMPPTFYDEDEDEIIKMIIQALDTKKIDGEKIVYLKQKQYMVNSRVVNNDKYDYWVSRLQFAKHFKCEPQNVKISDIYVFLLQG